ncbi:MAG: PA14 domain-containing protein, partial [Leadbetterella sp.]
MKNWIVQVAAYLSCLLFFIFSDIAYSFPGPGKDSRAVIKKSNEKNLKSSFFIITNGGVMGTNEAENQAYVPSPITVTTAPIASPTTTNYTYQWQSSSDGNTWTSISGATGATYSPGSISTTTYYRRLIRDNTSTNWQGVSNIVTKAVTNYVIAAPASVAIGGTINLSISGSYSDFFNNINTGNPNFSNGSAGFSSDISLNPTSSNGTYLVRDYVDNTSGNAGLAFDWYTPANNFNDFSGSGRMMIIDGVQTVNNTIPNNRLWYNSFNLTNGNTYRLSTMAREFYPGSITEIDWYRGGTKLGADFPLTNSWTNLQRTFTANSTGSVELSIRQLNNSGTNGGGNDLALDDVYIYEDTPITYQWTYPDGTTTNTLSPSITNAQSGNSGVYTLRATKNGITVITTVSVSVGNNLAICSSQAPTFTLTPNNPACFGATGSITVNNTQNGNGGTGNASYQIYSGILGNSIASLTGSPGYPNSASFLQIDKTEGLRNFDENYGSRISGYIVPQQSGTYRFWIASNDNGEFRISTNSSSGGLPSAATASVSSFTNYNEWNKETSQRSASITLVAGQLYYFEALQKEVVNNDHLQIGWTKPGDPVSTTAPTEIIPAWAIRPNTPAALTEPVYTYRIGSGAYQNGNSFSGLSATTSGTS